MMGAPEHLPVRVRARRIPGQQYASCCVQDAPRGRRAATGEGAGVASGQAACISRSERPQPRALRRLPLRRVRPERLRHTGPMSSRAGRGSADVPPGAGRSACPRPLPPPGGRGERRPATVRRGRGGATARTRRSASLRNGARKWRIVIRLREMPDWFVFRPHGCPCGFYIDAVKERRCSPSRALPSAECVVRNVPNAECGMRNVC